MGFADGLFVMTTATDHKNNLNRSEPKRDNARKLRVETIANSAGGTAQVAVVAQPSTGFLNGRSYVAVVWAFFVHPVQIVFVPAKKTQDRND